MVTFFPDLRFFNFPICNFITDFMGQIIPTPLSSYTNHQSAFLFLLRSLLIPNILLPLFRGRHLTREFEGFPQLIHFLGWLLPLILPWLEYNRWKIYGIQNIQFQGLFQLAVLAHPFLIQSSDFEFRKNR